MASRRPVTIFDVARAAGVSKTTASDALNGSTRVAARTAARVQVAAEDLGYFANSAAQSLRHGGVGTVGLYARWSAGAAAEWYVSVFQGVLERANAIGTDVVVLSDLDGLRRSGVPRCEGVIVIDPDADDPVMRRLLNGTLPVVTGYEALERRAVRGWVRADHGTAFKSLAEHLEERGARSVGFIYCPERTPWAMELKDAYDAWSACTSIECRSAPAPVLWSPAQIDEALDGWLDGFNAVDAVICCPVGSATYVASRAQERGRSIGRDLLLASCVDGAAMENWTPSITAIDDHPKVFGSACFDLLLRCLDEPRAATTEMTVAARVVQRASTIGAGKLNVEAAGSL